MTAALAGVQTMHVSAYDEALGVPTEAAATLALRTQQVVAFETGLTETVDPFAGSYAVEALTDELEPQIQELLADDRAARRGAGLHRVRGSSPESWPRRRTSTRRPSTPARGRSSG